MLCSGCLRCMVFLLGCMRVRCGAQCIWVKAVNLVASYKRGICVPWGAFLEWRTAQQIGRCCRECGQEPLQFFWFRASISFFNSMLDSNSETLLRVLKADLHLASFDSSCWSAQVSNAFNGLQGSAMFKQKMLRATQVPMQEFICDLRLRHF